MNINKYHTFHVPVMGTSFTIDAPIKVARFGISSVMAIGDAALCEQMRSYYAPLFGLSYIPIPITEYDFRAKRITAYLNLVDEIVKNQIKEMKQQSFTPGTDLTKYFELLPETSSLKQDYQSMIGMQDGKKKDEVCERLKTEVKPGSIDVNIMTKVDRDRVHAQGQPIEYNSDALSSFRGFAQSMLESSIVFSAGFNRRLYAYVDKFKDFLPDRNGKFRKKIILKVSDFRSSLTQGKFLAKHGLWVSEHRIESGLNCGGHSFPANGKLMGPIMEEFKGKKESLVQGLFDLYKKALSMKEFPCPEQAPDVAITVQGGIGTATEDQFLLKHYNLQGTGWGTPLLLVPEATTIDDESRRRLAESGKENLYLSNVSPLSIPFNNFKQSLSEDHKRELLEKGESGSACPKGHLALFNTEFSETPLCVAGKAYQKKKITQLQAMNLSKDEYEKAYNNVTAKSCLCEDLAAGALTHYGIDIGRPLYPAVCPGPSLAYFSKIVSLTEMAGHIYGRINLIAGKMKPHMFIEELKLYIDNFADELKALMPKSLVPKIDPKEVQHFIEFRDNLLSGIEYYKTLFPKIAQETKRFQESSLEELNRLKDELEAIISSYQFIFA
ncbi:hypothetical protein ACFL96_01840 [Thermoproteota archaeon]